MKNPLKTFEPNLLGRDFVIGDLHGAYDTFLTLLEGIDFDPEKDRMFSVGDLVDRGTKSQECLRLMREPWFHCTLSNHEQMMYEAFHGGRMGQYWLQNGGFWGYSTLVAHDSLTRDGAERIIPDDEQAELIDLIAEVVELPYLITINHKNGKKFHVLHAELPPKFGDDQITDEMLADPETVQKLAKVQTRDGGDCFLWARYRFGMFARVPLDNVLKAERAALYAQSASTYSDKLSHIYSGHTIVRKPLTLYGQTNLDTCAYGSDQTDSWHALTCVCLDDGKFYQSTLHQFIGEVEPVVINIGY